MAPVSLQGWGESRASHGELEEEAGREVGWGVFQPQVLGCAAQLRHRWVRSTHGISPGGASQPSSNLGTAKGLGRRERWLVFGPRASVAS